MTFVYVIVLNTFASLFSYPGPAVSFFNPLQIPMELILAARLGNIAEINSLLAKGSVINETDGVSRT